MKVKKSSLVLSFLLTSCVGSLTNNIDSKIDAKIDSKVNANASVQTNTNAAVNANANVKTGAVNTNIQPPKVRRVKSVSVSPSNFTINVGDEIKLLGSVKYDDESVDNNIAWFSSNGSIAKINSESGVLNVLGEGKVEIVAASRIDASITTTISVTVNSKNAVRVDPIPTFTPIPSPIITATPIQSSIPISTPTPIATPLPTNGDRVIFSGKVYDINQNPVNGATVTAKSVDAGVPWIGQATQTSGGAYVFRNAPVGARIEVSVTKDGWTTRTRSEILKANLNGDPKANTFDFGFDGSTGSTDPNALYAIQDEPEITSLKINGVLATDSALGSLNSLTSPADADTNLGSPATTSVSPNSLTIEMIFSEEVNRSDVENYFRVLSTVGTNVASTGSFCGILANQPKITINSFLPIVNFTWGTDGKSVTMKTNKGILANADGSPYEARYLLDFTNQFRDLVGKKSFSHRCFNFSPRRLGGFHLFSVANQTQQPYITEFRAINGTAGSDYLKIKFSMPMDVIGRKALAAVLSDPAKIYTDQVNSLKAMVDTTPNKGSTLLGFNDVTTGRFVPVYHIAKIFPQLKSGITPTQSFSLNNIQGAENLIVKSAEVDSNDSNTIIIELNQDAFDANDKIVLSAGAYLSGNYSGDQSMTNSLNFTTTYSSSVFNSVVGYSSTSYTLAPSFSELLDPSGKVLDRGNATTSVGFSVTNAQKLALAG